MRHPLLLIVSAVLAAGAWLACGREPPPVAPVVTLPPSAPVATSPAVADSGAPQPAPFARVDIPGFDGGCPLRIHPMYCRFRCRTFADRSRAHHARRITDPARYALGTCGPYRAFAEEERDGGAILELFTNDPGVPNDPGGLAAAMDSRQPICKTFLLNGLDAGVSCVPALDWHPSAGAGTGDDD